MYAGERLEFAKLRPYLEEALRLQPKKIRDAFAKDPGSFQFGYNHVPEEKHGLIVVRVHMANGERFLLCTIHWSNIAATDHLN